MMRGRCFGVLFMTYEQNLVLRFEVLNGEGVSYGLLGCDTVWSCRWLMFEGMYHLHLKSEITSP
jgi:hypothetical protein